MPRTKSKLYPDLKPANDSERFMLEAIKEAEKAIALGECPIGCVLVKDGKIYTRSHNLRLTKGNSLAHAEVIAINKACKKLGEILAGAGIVESGRIPWYTQGNEIRYKT